LSAEKIGAAAQQRDAFSLLQTQLQNVIQFAFFETAMLTLTPVPLRALGCDSISFLVG
jgi:hypothetical protein